MIFLLRFTIRHFSRHWRMNLILSATLLLATTFLASLPLYASAIAGRNLHQQLLEARPPIRNIEVRATTTPLTSPMFGQIQGVLGPLVKERIDILETGQPGALRSANSLLQADGQEREIAEELYFRVWAFDSLFSNVEVMEGRLPVHLTAPPNQLSAIDIEVAIGPEAAADMALQVGDSLRTADNSLVLNVVGLVRPAEPDADMWWGDPLPFGRERIVRGNAPDIVRLSVLMPVPTMMAYIPNHQHYWRILTDISAITVDNAPMVQSDLDSLQGQISADFNTGLTEMLATYLTQLAQAQVTLFLLTTQSLLFVLYTVMVVSSFIVDQSRAELVTLSGRGFTPWQLSRVYLLEGLFLAFGVAWPLGPLFAYFLVQRWAVWGNIPALAALPLLSWQLAAVAAFSSWLALLLPIGLAARGNLLAYQRQVSRPEQHPLWQRYYFDFFLLALSGLIYWQLTQAGSFVTLSGGDSPAGIADPVLLLGPSLLLIAVAMLFSRFFPYWLRLANFWGQRGAGFILPFEFAKLARDPVSPGRVVLLITLATGLTFFASVFSNSLQTRQSQMAHYLSGADLVVGFAHNAPQHYDEIIQLPGITAASPAYRNSRLRYGLELGRRATLLAVDPTTLPQVSAFAPAITNLTLPAVMEALRPAESAAIPAILSADAYPPTKKIGDQIIYVVGSQQVLFEVRGIIINFPSLSGPFLLTNLPILEQEVNLGRLLAPFQGEREAWLELDPAGYQSLLQTIPTNNLGRIAADSQAKLNSLQANLPAAETVAAFNLNGFMLTILSVAVFLLIHFFSAYQRLREFSILQAIGVSPRQLLILLSLEGVVLVFLGLAAGTTIGYGLAALMRPFLSGALAEAIAGGAIYRLWIDWLNLSGLYLLLITLFALALFFSLLALLRIGIQRALHLGEE